MGFLAGPELPRAAESDPVFGRGGGKGGDRRVPVLGLEGGKGGAANCEVRVFGKGEAGSAGALAAGFSGWAGGGVIGLPGIGVTPESVRGSRLRSGRGSGGMMKGLDAVVEGEGVAVGSGGTLVSIRAGAEGAGGRADGTVPVTGEIEGVAGTGGGADEVEGTAGARGGADEVEGTAGARGGTARVVAIAGVARGIPGMACVEGKAGGRAWCEMGWNSSPFSSVLPVSRKIRAFGLATTTRGGGMGLEAMAGAAEGRAGGRAGGSPGAFASVAGGRRLPTRGGKRGAVSVDRGASRPEGGGGSEPGSVPVGGRGLGMGLVTAVDQAGGTFCEGAGMRFGGAPRGSVVAPETGGRRFGGDVTGFGGRGGRLMRRVSRLGGVEPGPWGGGGLAGSAMETFL